MATIIQTKPTKNYILNGNIFPLFGLDADLLAVRLDLIGTVHLQLAGIGLMMSGLSCNGQNTIAP